MSSQVLVDQDPSLTISPKDQHLMEALGCACGPGWQGRCEEILQRREWPLGSYFGDGDGIWRWSQDLLSQIITKTWGINIHSPAIGWPRCQAFDCLLRMEEVFLFSFSSCKWNPCYLAYHRLVVWWKLHATGGIQYQNWELGQQKCRLL